MHIEGGSPGAAGPTPYSLDQHLGAARKLAGGEAVSALAEAFNAGHLQLTEDIELPGGWKVGPIRSRDPGVMGVTLPEGRGAFVVYHKDHPFAQPGEWVSNPEVTPLDSPLARSLAPSRALLAAREAEAEESEEA